ncbi:MAG: LPXTG cell wall anchor domain-containing protein [Acidimicrobiales bacterium]
MSKRLAAGTAFMTLGALAFSGAAASGVAAAGAPAGIPASSSGVGSASAKTTVLGLSLGKDGALLDVSVLADTSGSTIDPRIVSTPLADTKLSPLNITSRILPALNVAAPSAEARSSGSVKPVAVPGFSVPAVVPPSVLRGTVQPASLSAVVDANGARSGLTNGLKDLAVASGAVLSVPSAASDLSTSAGSFRSTGLRGVTVDNVTALKLGALLKGLGIDPMDLPLSTVLGLVDKLGTTVPGVADTAALHRQLVALNGAVSALSGTLAAAGAGPVVSDLPSNPLAPVNSALAGVASATGAPVTPLVPGVTSVSDVGTLLSTLTSRLRDLVSKTAAALDSAPLLSVSGLQVGLDTQAGDTIANSRAGVTATIGSVHIGNLTVPGTDLLHGMGPVDALVGTVTSKVADVLSTVSPSLSHLVSVKVFSKNAAVSATGGYTHADAGVTGLTVAITPPADLANVAGALHTAASTVGSIGGILAGVPGAAGATGAIAGAGGGGAPGVPGVPGVGGVPSVPVPGVGGVPSVPVPGVAATLASTGTPALATLPALAQATAVSGLANGLGLPAGVGALSEGAVLTVASVQAGSNFGPAGTASAVGSAAAAGSTGLTSGGAPAQLPRTGDNQGLLAMVGALLVGFGAVLARWGRRTNHSGGALPLS